MESLLVIIENQITDRDDKFRLVFIQKQLSDINCLVSLAHKEGRLLNKHLSNSIFLNTKFITRYKGNERRFCKRRLDMRINYQE